MESDPCMTGCNMSVKRPTCFFGKIRTYHDLHNTDVVGAWVIRNMDMLSEYDGKTLREPKCYKSSAWHLEKKNAKRSGMRTPSL
jgi:hypothetical protein